MKALQRNKRGLVEALEKGPYREPALVPASPWLKQPRPAAPEVSVSVSGEKTVIALTLKPGDGEPPFLWAVSTRYGAKWTHVVQPAASTRVRIKGEKGAWPVVSIAAVSRTGETSRPLPLSISHVPEK